MPKIKRFPPERSPVDPAASKGEPAPGLRVQHFVTRSEDIDLVLNGSIGRLAILC
jgi:hypothetical protein